jgi:hypothetical protein
MSTSKKTRAAMAAAKSSAAKNRGRRHGRDNREPSTRGNVKYGTGCWCGEPFGHDWPGKGDGAPHPR